MATLPRLVLHVDVNETIMAEDAAGGDTFEDTLNKVLCKNSFVRATNGHPEGGGAEDVATEVPKFWYDGTPIGTSEPPPLLPEAWEEPHGCTRAYRTHLKTKARRFSKVCSGWSLREWMTTNKHYQGTLAH